jgi:hypothetical protein
LRFEIGAEDEQKAFQRKIQKQTLNRHEVDHRETVLASVERIASRTHSHLKINEK